MQAFVRLPYLGALENNEIVEYLLLNLTTRSALITVPNWAYSFRKLKKDSLMDLRLINLLQDPNQYIEDLKGVILPLRTFGPDNNPMYRVQFETPIKGHMLLKRILMPRDDLYRFLIELTKDTLLIKNGVYIYFKHLIPFFSRLLTISSSRYEDLKNKMMNEIHLQIFFNMSKLENIYEKAASSNGDLEVLLSRLDINGLKNSIQSELDKTLFELAFGNFHFKLDEKVEKYSVRSFQNYIDAIKSLELRLYSNYNNIVTLYTQAIHNHRLTDASIDA